MRRKIVIALGGNALGNTPLEQLELIKNTSKNIVDVILDGYDVVITHGNGPQVGMINLAMQISHEEANTPDMPFAECGAMSQGYIGYHLQQSIQKELLKRNIRKNCITVITQVLVDDKDEAFKNLTKPIGSFYTKEEANKIAKEKGYVFKEDAGRGYRRVVASPNPVKIIENKVIRDLVNKRNIVIAAGGGGIPIIKKRNGYQGVDAVIDKDKTSAKLAIDLNADIFLILTAVEKVCINYGKENEQKLDFLTVKQAKEYMKNDEFKKGSMLPKIEACIDYVTHKKDGQAIITSLSKLKDALLGKTGTIIVRKEK